MDGERANALACFPGNNRALKACPFSPFATLPLARHHLHTNMSLPQPVPPSWKVILSSFHVDNIGIERVLHT